RRRMPWMAVEKKYEFGGPKGKVSLLDLFEGRKQLIVYRAFFEPGVFGWPEHACRGCSLGADQVSHLAHLNARDTTLAWASRAPQADISRMGLKARAPGQAVRDTPTATWEELVAFRAAAKRLGYRSVATASLVTWEWLQREKHVFGAFEVAHYRPRERPNSVGIVHHKNG